MTGRSCDKAQGDSRWMRSVGVILLAAIFSVCPARAQLLYKISGNGLACPSYIVGTYHLAPATFANKIAGIGDAINATEQVYGELKTDEMLLPENARKMEDAMKLPDGKTLEDVLTAGQLAEVNAFMKEMLGADLSNATVASTMGRMTPQALTTSFTALLYLQRHSGGFDPLNLIDDYFQKVAERNGEPVGGLETVDFQISALFSGMAMERQVELLMCLIENRDFMTDCVDKILNAYYSQDINAVQSAMDEKLGNSCDSTPEEDAELIYERNAAWVRQMPAVMAERPTLFVVGVGHLPGDKGVLSLLGEAGYDVEACQ